jgi:NADPH:quinone reductase-like Zn-dependent oxidoreductase
VRSRRARSWRNTRRIHRCGCQTRGPEAKDALYAGGSGSPSGIDHCSPGIGESGPSFTDHVLVHGGTGGVGHIGVQLAKVLGCQVATTVGTNEDFDLVRRLGADQVINFREEKVEAYVEF